MNIFLKRILTKSGTFYLTSTWHTFSLASISSARQEKISPTFGSLTYDDMENFYLDIRKVLDTKLPLLREMCHYYFDATGKSIRPKIVFLAARTCNTHFTTENSRLISDKQRKVAMIAEMIHTGSLIHDDVVDMSNLRRGKHSVNNLWGDRNATLTGNYVLARASHLLASIGETEVITIITKIIDDLVRGEFMQMDNSDDFSHYLTKTYKKTASLIANSCRAVAYLSGCPDDIIEAMYQYGRNVGIAFQLVDDILDFSQSDERLGKPAAADLRLGLATAPVLFACHKHPHLHNLILRRFKKPGDVKATLEAVRNSEGIEETHLLAQHYCQDAKRNLRILTDSNEKSALLDITEVILHRSK